MYLYGASGHAKVIIDMLQATGQKVDALFDDDKSINELMSIPVLHDWNGESPLVVSVGNNISRKQIVENWIANLAQSFIHQPLSLQTLR